MYTELSSTNASLKPVTFDAPPPALSNCVWILDVTPSRYPSSVSGFPDPFEVNALEAAVRSFEAIVVAAPVIVAFFASSFADDTPSKIRL